MKSPVDHRFRKETSSASPAVSPARSDALRILLRYRKDGRLLNSSCEQPENRRLADQIAFGTVQNGRFLDAVLDSHVRTGVRELQCAVREILRMSAFQILFLDRVPDSAAVNEAVSLCRLQKCSFAAGFVNAVLRNLARGKYRIAIREPAVRYSHPDWVYSRLVRDFGESFTEAFLSANQVRPDLRLQLNTQRCGTDAYVALLEEKGIAVLDLNRELDSVLIRSCDPAALPGYDEGFFYVQDDAARAAALRPACVSLTPARRPAARAWPPRWTGPRLPPVTSVKSGLQDAVKTSRGCR